MNTPNEKPPKNILQDEQGSWSAARTLLVLQLTYVDAVATWAMISPVLDTSPEWWAYQGTLSVGLIAWAAGPRGLQYIGSKIGDVAKGLKGAADRFVRVDNRYTDDERGRRL